MNDLARGRLRREQRTLDAMIAITCGKLHGGRRGALCAECAELRAYAELRLVRCPFGTDKPTCANCQVHCYKPEMRERVRRVMRYAGPRMLTRHPVLALLHLLVDERRPAPAKPARRSASAATQPSARRMRPASATTSPTSRTPKAKSAAR
jgi:hypothetical protein